MPAAKRRPMFLDETDDAADGEFVAGQDEALEKLEYWLRSKVATNPEIEGDVYLDLAQLGGGSKMPIQSLLFHQGDEVDTVARMILDAATSDGESVARGKTSYVVTIQGRPGRCSFSLDFAPRGDDEANETPNGPGLVAQALRHTEKMTSMMVQVVERAQRDGAEQRRELMEENRSLRAREVEGIQTLASLYDARHARDLETKKLEKSEDRKDHVAGMLMQGIPAIVNRVAGQRVITEPSTPLEQMLLGLLSTFKPEDLQRMMTTGTIQLQKDQMMGFLEIFRVVQEKFEAAQSQAASRPPQPQHQNGATGPAAHEPPPTYPIPPMQSPPGA